MKVLFHSRSLLAFILFSLISLRSFTRAELLSTGEDADAFLDQFIAGACAMTASGVNQYG